MNGINQAMIDVRGVKQAIWKREMDRRPTSVSSMPQSTMKALITGRIVSEPIKRSNT